MESQAQMKKEYDQILALYSTKRTETQNLEKSHKQISQDIQNLEKEIQKLSSTPVDDKPIITEQQTHQLNQITQQVQQLKEVLKHEQEQHQQSSNNHTQINQLTQLNNTIQLNLQQLNSAGPTVTQITERISHLTQLQNQNQQQQFEIQLLNKDVYRDEQEVAQLQRQLLQLESNAALHSIQNIDSHHFQDLEDELAQLQKEFTQTEEAVHILKQRQVAQQQKQQRLKKQQQNQLNTLTNHNQQLTVSKKQYQEELANLQSSAANKSIQLDKDKKIIEEDNQKKLKQIQSLKKQLVQKKAEEQKRRVEEKNKKNKEKPRNFKQEIIEANTLYDVYNKQLQRQKDKLTGLAQLKKTYATNQNLQILQKQLQRHQNANKASLPAEQLKKDRILKQNHALKSRIQFLKRSTKQLEQDSLQQVKEANAKGDELVDQKLAHERLFKNITSKLNDYMKEYPDHEKNKQDKKNQEKRLKHELKEKERQKIRLEKEKEKTKKSQINIDDSSQTDKVEDTNKNGWDQWKEWDNSGRGSEATILKNRLFQIGCGLVALIAILLLSYGV